MSYDINPKPKTIFGADAGLVGPLSVLLAPAHPSGPAVHRDGHHRRADPRRPGPLCTSTPRNTRWRCNWVAVSRLTWPLRPLGQDWGYDEVNLNCGCPSDRVQSGLFGACLMARPQLVADGVRAMRDACTIPVTVKHRIGIDHMESYGELLDFIGPVAEAGCEVLSCTPARPGCRVFRPGKTGRSRRSTTPGSTASSTTSPPDHCDQRRHPDAR